MIQIEFLGTGTSQGVPLIGCKCEVCYSANKQDKRLRSSIKISSANTHLVIDTGPDFRYQMLRSGQTRLDAVLFTHGHKDHTAGLDDIRAFNYFQNQAIDVYANQETQEVLKREFSYVFSGIDYPGIPQINLIELKNESFSIGDINILPIEVWHHKLQVFGFRINDFVYITDANYISPKELEKVINCKILVLNALRHEAHISHFTLEQAIQLSHSIGAEKTYFTHISHQLGLHQKINHQLPDGMSLAFDGLKITI